MFGFGKKARERKAGAAEYSGAQADGMNGRDTPRVRKLVAGKLKPSGYTDGTPIAPGNSRDLWWKKGS